MKCEKAIVLLPFFCYAVLMEEMDKKDPLDDLFRISGSFKDRALEREYNNNIWSGYSTRIRIVSIFTGLAYLSGVFSDIPSLGFSPELAYMFAARLITLLSALYCVFASFKKFSSEKTQNILFLYFMVITLSECIELLLKPEIGGEGLPLLIIIVLFYYLVFPVPLLFSVGGSLSATILYGSILIFVHNYPLGKVLPTIMTFLLVTVTSFYFSRSLKRANRSEAYVMMQLKQANEDLQNEIREKQQVQKRLEELVTLDELTKVYNRRHFRELANRELQRAGRTGQFVSLLFMDIDHFKVVNDSYGHSAGDEVLKKIAQTCQNSIRDLDIFARLGGEEFVFLLPEINISQAEITAERIRKIISGTLICTDSDEIRVTASFGVSAYHKEKSETLDKMVQQADKALYEAKERGRDRVVVYSGNF